MASTCIAGLAREGHEVVLVELASLVVEEIRSASGAVQSGVSSDGAGSELGEIAECGHYLFSIGIPVVHVHHELLQSLR